MRLLAMLLLILMSSLFGIARAADDARIYRWIGEDGSVTFSSQPPPPGIKGQQIDMPTPRQVIVQDPAVLQKQLQQSESLGQELDAKRQAREQLQRDVTAAEADVAAAEQALESGREPQAGEVQRIATGTRLLPAYFERIKQLEAAVAAAKQRLDTLKNQ